MPWIKHEGVEKPAEVPESAVPHWESLGWTLCDPPEHRRPRRQRTAPQPVEQPAANEQEAVTDQGTTEPAAAADETPAAAAPPPDEQPAETDAAPAAGRKKPR